LGILSFYGIEEYARVLPFFKSAAVSDDWNLREFAQMFFRKLIQTRPDEMHEYLLQLASYPKNAETKLELIPTSAQNTLKKTL
jgi:hypothetical protein